MKDKLSLHIKHSKTPESESYQQTIDILILKVNSSLAVTTQDANQH